MSLEEKNDKEFIEQLIIEQLTSGPKSTAELQKYLPIREFLKKTQTSILAILDTMVKKEIIYSDYVTDDIISLIH
jgi:DNA-binding PadR family transcriptional regulator